MTGADEARRCAMTKGQTMDELVERHITVLNCLKDRTPVYMGDDPEAKHYQGIRAALDAAITALAATDLVSVIAERDAAVAALKLARDITRHGNCEFCDRAYEVVDGAIAKIEGRAALAPENRDAG